MKKRCLHDKILLFTVAIATVMFIVGMMGLDGDAPHASFLIMVIGMAWDAIFLHANEERFR